jgi:transposase
LSRTSIHRIWQAFSLVPHRSETFKLSKDPLFVEKVDVHLIPDNYGTHKTAKSRSWLAKRPRFHLYFTPVSASWLNLVERWFAALTEKQLRRGIRRSIRELEAAIKAFHRRPQQQSQNPFVCHKTADQILDSVARFCKRSLETALVDCNN